jgi:cbb3-type cytochrome oxidase subunit 3
MDINVIRIAVTVVSMAAFVAIVWWAYQPARRAKLAEEGRRILEERE